MNSMTGFGRGESENELFSIVVEIKSVNHRFLDCQFHMPRRLAELESAMRQTIKQTVSRGRLDIYVTVNMKQAAPKKTQVDWTMIQQMFVEIQTESQQRFGFVPDKQRLLEQLLLQEEVMTITEEPLSLDRYQDILFQALDHALHRLVMSRSQEGTRLNEVFLEQYNQIKTEHGIMTTYATQFEQEHQEKLVQAIRLRIGEEVDEVRLLTEVALLLEKGDIHEELDRLMIHLEHVTRLLSEKKPVGRELDFLIQEMNREVNTIGSKTAIIEMKNSVVLLKTIIEKMREQIQNIE